jgi:hypothetical protein
MLGVDIRTVQRREAGDIPITKEAERAIRALHVEERTPRLLETLVRQRIPRAKPCAKHLSRSRSCSRSAARRVFLVLGPSFTASDK